MPKIRKQPLLVAVGFSPREKGNSDLLLEWAITGARQAGARTRKIFVRDYKINYCRGCRHCESAGECIQKDDFSKFSKELDRADHLIVSTPVFFLNVPGQAKAAIDRFQTQWSRKYLLGKPPGREQRPALVLMVAGSDRPRLFDCVKRTLNAWFSVAGFRSAAEIGVAAVDAKGAVSRPPGLEQRMQEAGKNLIGVRSSIIN
jgi:NAD(P)H-dependent FMN reductase